jgi:hypothetical protein
MAQSQVASESQSMTVGSGEGPLLSLSGPLGTMMEKGASPSLSSEGQTFWTFVPREKSSQGMWEVGSFCDWGLQEKQVCLGERGLVGGAGGHTEHEGLQCPVAGPQPLLTVPPLLTLPVTYSCDTTPVTSACPVSSRTA